ncbi:uncharacterized protein METZ01_LOCUS109886 [marine metagenome]|uniref:Nucleotide-diphospho-sugar transferase domain-containing protein n=1 Tax=marine metagenome TaxID=408172 RepID=A0A381WXG5_9ZZZZ
MSSKLVITAAAGPPKYFTYCYKSQKQYAENISADYHILTTDDMTREYPTPNFLIFKAYKYAEEHGYEHVLFTDADVIVNSKTPPFWETFPTGMALRYGWGWEKVVKWAKENLNEDVFGLQERYYSPGLGIADAESASKLNAIAKPPFYKGKFAGGGNLEQFNYFVAKAGIKITPMPAQYHYSRHWPLGISETRGDLNSGEPVNSLDDVYFLHYPGEPKIPRILKDGFWKTWIQ